MVTLTLIVAVLFSLFPSADAEPRAINLKRIKANCNRVTVAFKSDNPDGATEATVRGWLDGVEIGSITGDPTGFVARFSYSPTAGTHTVTGEITVGAESLSGTIAVECVDKEKSKTKPDKRICFAPGQAPAAIYLRGGIEVWAIDANDEGRIVIDVSERELRRLPDRPASVVPIAQSDWRVRVQVMKNPDGGMQINVGPDGEGKIFECLFDLDTPENAEVRTWLIP